LAAEEEAGAAEMELRGVPVGAPLLCPDILFRPEKYLASIPLRWVAGYHHETCRMGDIASLQLTFPKGM